MAFSFHSFQQFVIHLLSGDIFRNVHLRVSLGDNMVLGYATAQEFFFQHFKNG